ncbi:hypothetical protein GW17_00048275, partial [Ensete ventricosum]
RAAAAAAAVSMTEDGVAFEVGNKREVLCGGERCTVDESAAKGPTQNDRPRSVVRFPTGPSW